MGGKDRQYLYSPERFHRSLGAHASIAHALQGSAERAWLGGLVGMNVSRTTTPFSMIGFSEVGQLEVDRESFGDPIGFLNAQAFDGLPGLCHFAIVRIGGRSGINPGLDQQSPQLLNILKDGISG